MLSELAVTLVVLVSVLSVWFVRPARWFRSRRREWSLPDVWLF